MRRHIRWVLSRFITEGGVPSTGFVSATIHAPFFGSGVPSRDVRRNGPTSLDGTASVHRSSNRQPMVVQMRAAPHVSTACLTLSTQSGIVSLATCLVVVVKVVADVQVVVVSTERETEGSEDPPKRDRSSYRDSRRRKSRSSAWMKETSPMLQGCWMWAMMDTQTHVTLHNAWTHVVAATQKMLDAMVKMVQVHEKEYTCA